jgi:hypothetical protein
MFNDILIFLFAVIFIFLAVIVSIISNNLRGGRKPRSRSSKKAVEEDWKRADRENQWRDISSDLQTKRVDDLVGEVVNYHNGRVTRRLQRQVRRGGRKANSAMRQIQEINKQRDIEVSILLKRVLLGKRGHLGSVDPRTGETRHGIGRAGHGTRGHSLVVNPKKTKKKK